MDPMSLVPARMITMEIDGFRMASKADRKPIVESFMYSTMAEAVHPGRPLQRTTTPDSDSLEEEDDDDDNAEDCRLWLSSCSK